MKLITIENNELINKIHIQKINNNIIRKKPVVLYFYMEECPYCVTTTNEWNQIPNHINNEILDEELLATRINHILFGLLNNVGEQPTKFPNIRYINGISITHYNKEGVERNAHDLARWIEDKQSKKSLLMNPEKSYLQIKQIKRKSLRKRKSLKKRKFFKKRKSIKKKINNIPLHI